MAIVKELAYHRNSEAITAPAYVSARALAANTAESITIPVDADSKRARYVRLSSSGDFYVDWNGDAAVVPTDLDDGSAAEYKPTGLHYIGDLPENITALSIISAGTPIVTAAFFM